VTLSLTDLAKAGFVDLSRARELLDELSEETSVSAPRVMEAISHAADPDRALAWLLRLSRTGKEHHARIQELLGDPESARKLCLIVGGSRGLAEFCERHVSALELFSEPEQLPQDQYSLSSKLLDELKVRDQVAGIGGEQARVILRSSYRTWLLSIALWDLSHQDPQSQVKNVTRALSDCAGAALEGALAVARFEALSTFSESEISQTDIAIIAMGKCGARELNYLSDVDVIFVAEPTPDSSLPVDKALTVATWLAQTVSKVINEPSVEPGLWEVDANLRPEGKDGALVRTLESHRSYYERWAKDWEFQALLKARPIAGSRALGQAYFEAVSQFVWSSAARSNFVEQVQRMRERVTENIPEAEIELS
jgi:glutamate-ammonia-ligase adenylyltransferase